MAARNLSPIRSPQKSVVIIPGSFAPATGPLAYDGQSGNFTAGLVLTGTTSGATGLIEADVDGGTTGTLTLSGVVGTFVDNEAITDSSTGAAVVNGNLAGSYSTIRYDGQTGNFTVGKTVTGTTSKATAKVVLDQDDGAAGTLTITDVVGTFQDNEALTDPGTGAAVVNGSIAAPANVPTAVKGLGFTVAWTSAGLWTVTFSDFFAELISIKASYQAVTAVGKVMQVKAISLTAKTAQLVLWDKAGAAPLDVVANANTRIHFVAWFRDSQGALNIGG